MGSRSMRITSSLLAALASIAAAGAAAAQKSEVTIGFVNPTTGVFGSLGKYARKGVDLALDQAQKNPTFKEVTFKVIERDTAAKPGEAIRYARELVSRYEADVVMGGLSSAECLALQKLAPEIQTAYLPTSGCSGGRILGTCQRQQIFVPRHREQQAAQPSVRRLVDEDNRQALVRGLLGLRLRAVGPQGVPGGSSSRRGHRGRLSGRPVRDHRYGALPEQGRSVG